MKSVRKNCKKSARGRLRFPEDEARLSWLPLLLEACSIIDAGVQRAVGDFEKKSPNLKLACKKGCGHCCRTHTDIPLYPLELAGIYWFCTERMARPARDALKARLQDDIRQPKDGAGGKEGCVFLEEGFSCSIHPVRPVACRQFNVFGRPCGPGEDPYFTSRQDVLTPIREYTDRAFLVMLPFYGIHDEARKEKAVRDGLLHTQAINLRSMDWTRLLKVMEGFEAEKQGRV